MIERTSETEVEDGILKMENSLHVSIHILFSFNILLRAWQKKLLFARLVPLGWQRDMLVGTTQGTYDPKNYSRWTSIIYIAATTNA